MTPAEAVRRFAARDDRSSAWAHYNCLVPFDDRHDFDCWPEMCCAAAMMSQCLADARDDADLDRLIGLSEEMFEDGAFTESQMKDVAKRLILDTIERGEEKGRLVRRI